MFEETSRGQHRFPGNSSGWVLLAAGTASCKLALAAGLGAALSCSSPGSPEAQAGAGAGGGASSIAGDAATGGDADSINPCAPEVRQAASPEALFEPPGLPNVPLDSVAGVLTLYASTLEVGDEGLELYAGICNEGDAPLCGAAIQVEFYDQADQLIGTASGGVQSGQLYSFSQSPTPISCVAPGQAAMAVVKDLPEGLVIEQLKSLGHRFPAFQIDDAEPIPSVAVSELRVARIAAGMVFQGTVTNVATTTVSDPVVSVFPVNAEGRPVGHAASAEVLQLPPGGTWSFQTSVVEDVGVTQFAFASGSLMQAE